MFDKIKINLFLYRKNYFFFSLLFIYSILSNYALGYPPNLYAIIAIYLSIYLSIYLNKIIFKILFIVHSLICTIYIPEAIFYGKPSIGLIASLFETNRNEALEYLQSLPLYSYIIALLFFLFSLLIIILSNNIKPKKRKNTTIITYILLIFVAVLYKPISNTYKYNEPFDLQNTRVSIVGFYVLNYKSIKNYHLQKENLEKAKHINSTWKITNISPKYKNYVVIIGESMRADYLSLYGYPLKTTPFLDSTNGFIIDGYISAAPNTQTSLLRTLYHFQDEKTQYQNNIITLAKQAGFETYWISNQGQTSKFDTAASRVGYNADEYYFTQEVDSNLTINDTKLLPVFKEKINQKSDKPRLFVLHLMGSHPLFCKRILNKPVFKLKNKDMSCYLQSLLETDQFIQEVNNILKNTGSYSLVYFSDHGLSHEGKDRSLSLLTGNKYKQNYQVPFIKISSDDKERILIKTQRSAFNFIYGFAEWLGIQEETLDIGYQFFSAKPDAVKVFDWNNNVDFEQLPEDPAVTP